ncbi:MAG: hypothetical protein PHX38_06255 [Sulfuricella sp.]|nr:hypothetical protein [Sulfuricella sp.]
MRLRRVLKRRFSIAAAPLAVRRHVAWYWRLPALALLLAGGAIVSWYCYDAGMRFAGFERGSTIEELQRLREKGAALEHEIVGLRSKGTQNVRAMQIEQATQNDLAKTVKTLQDENAKLKEDLAFFRQLMSSDKDAGDLSIYRFKVERGGAEEYRYKLLILQGGQREREFQGRVQLLVNLAQNGKKQVMVLPSQRDAESGAFNVNFKFYRRLEGAFQVEPGSLVRNVQVQVFENGSTQPKLTQSVNLS